MKAAVGRIDGDGDEAGDDPGPGTHGVVGDVEPESCAERIFFVLGAEHALGDVAAATWLGAGIPTGPPLDGEVERESDDGESPESVGGPAEMKRGEEGKDRAGGVARFMRQGVDVRELEFERGHAADLCDGDPREDDDHGHFESELEKVGDEDAPEAADECVNSSERNEQQERKSGGRCVPDCRGCSARARGRRE